MERPGPKAAAWATFCKPFADRYLKLAAAPAGMPSVALAFSRATLLRPDNLELADLRDGAQRAVPAAPSPAGQADPAEAKRLHRLADPLRNAKRFPEAIAEYQKIVALDPTDVDAWCDLADCLLNANKDKTSPLAAVCAAQARDELAWANLPSQTVRALRARIKTLTKLDPTLDEVEAVDREFAAKARLLAVEAAGAGDLETAGEIQAVIAVIAPPNPDCDDESDADNLALKINARDMAGTPVNVKPALQRDPITGEDVITATPLDSAKGLSLTLAPGKWTWANDLRIRWQIEPLKVEQKGVILVNCWPVGGSGTRVEELPNGHYWGFYTDNDIKIVRLFENARAAFRADRVNTLAVEYLKQSKTITAWVNGVKLLMIEMDAAQAAKAATLPVELRLGGYDGKDWGCKVSLKLLKVSDGKKPLADDPGFGARCRQHRLLPLGGGDLTRRLDLSGKSVEVTTNPDTVLERHADHFIMTAVPKRGEGWWQGISTSVVFPELTYVGDSRFRWRIEPAPAGTGRDGDFFVGAWPSAEIANQFGIRFLERNALKEVMLSYYDIALRDDYKARFLPCARGGEAFGENRTYEICQEKRGRVVSSWVNQVKMSEVELTDQRVRNAANTAVQFHFKRVGTLGMKVSLLEATFARTLPRAAATQPDPALDCLPVPALAGKTPAGKDLAGTIDFTGDAVQWDASPPETIIERHRDYFVMKPFVATKPRAEVSVTFGKAVNAGDIRARWRIEPLDRKAPGYVSIHGWPIPDRNPTGPDSGGCYVQVESDLVNGNGTWACQASGVAWDRGYHFHYAPSNGKMPVSANGTHEICFQKKGRFVFASANSKPLLVLELTDRQMNDEVANGNMKFWLEHSGAAGIKATLVELTVGDGPARATSQPEASESGNSLFH